MNAKHAQTAMGIIYIHTYIHTYIHACIYIHIYIYIYTYIQHAKICSESHGLRALLLLVYVYIYMYVYIHTYMHATIVTFTAVCLQAKNVILSTG